MPFTVKKVSNYGTKHPVVARLKFQPIEFLQWVNLPKAQQDRILGIYFDLAERLLKCHEIYQRLLLARAKAIAEVHSIADGRVKSEPHVIGIRGEAETFLYESKNFLRELVKVINVFFGTEFHEASALYDASRREDGDLAKWARKKFGADDNFTTMLVSEQDWVGELIRKRNAAEHPGERSGTLKIENFKVTKEGYLIPPTWRRDESPATDVFQDLETYLDNLLTLAEEVLVWCIFHRTESDIQVFEIPEKDRNPTCPIRLRLQAQIQMPAQGAKGS